MKKSVFFLFLFMLFFFQGCSGEADKLNISGMDESAIGVKSSTNAHSVTLVDVVNNQLIIKGLNLDSVTSIQLQGNSFDESFIIESQSASEIIANGLRNMAILASGAFSLIISDAHGASSYQVDFVMQNGSVTAAMLSDMGANDGDGLLYNQSAGKWEAKPLSGLNLIGTWDATANFPFLSNGGASSFPSQGDYYVVGLGGATTIDTITGWNAGDWILFNGSTWDKVTNTNDVVSFNGRQGIVTPALNDYTWAQIDKTVSAIGDITDVDVTGAANGKVLKHNGTNWYVGDDLTGGSAGAVDSTSILDGSIADIDIAGGIAQSKITNLVTDLAAKIPLTDIDIDNTLAADSDTKIPSQKAIKSYVDTLVAAAPTGDLKKDGSVVMTADFDMGTFDLTNVTLVDGVDVSALKTQSDTNATNIGTNNTAIGTNTTGLSNLSNVTNDAQIPLAYLDTSTSLSGNSDTKVPSQKAIKAYVDAAVVPFGSLTDQYLPRWEATGSAMVDSAIFEDGSGNIGIGTSSPDRAFHINGPLAGSTPFAKFSHAGSTTGSLEIASVTATATQFLPLISAYEDSDTLGRGALYLIGTVDNDTGTFLNSAINIDARNSASALSNRDVLNIGSYGSSLMRLKANGNLGIGTSSPESTLHIAGVMRLDANSATACTVAGDGGQFRYNAGSLEFCNGSAWQTLGISGAGLTSLGGQTNSSQTFATGASGTTHAISSSSNIHTLNIPLAAGAGVTSGTISKTEYDAFNSKLSATLTSTNMFVGNGSNVATAVAMSGDATMSNTGVVTVANDSVTYAKMQNISATDKLLGRATAGSGNTEEISLGSGLSYSGTTLNVTESDPKVGSLSTNYIPYWDGSSLVDSLMSQSGATLDVNGNIQADQFKLKSNGFTTSGAGWFRVGELNASNGRGECITSIATTGGSYTPGTVKTNWFHNGASAAYINTISASGGNHWSDFRITHDSTKSYLEVYFTTAILGNAEIKILPGSAYDNCTLYSGALTAGSGTVHAQVSESKFAIEDLFLVDTNGYVGIGIDNPLSIVHIKDSSGSADGSIKLSASVSSVYTAELTLDDTGMEVGHNSALRNLAFQTGNVDRVIIDGGGAVTIKNDESSSTDAFTINGGAHNWTTSILGLNLPRCACDISSLTQDCPTDYYHHNTNNCYDQMGVNSALYTYVTQAGEALKVNGNGFITVNQGIVQEAWKTVAFTNSWAHYGSTFAPASYYKDSLGIVHLRGLVKSGTLGACMFVLPLGYRTQYTKIFNVLIAGNIAGRLDIDSAGCVSADSSGNNTWVSLEGISFRAYQ